MTNPTTSSTPVTASPLTSGSDAPMTLQMNAWTGDDTRGVRGAAPDPAGWALRKGLVLPPQFLAPRVIDPRDWRDASVGWGLVLAEGATIPPAIEELRRARTQAAGAPPLLRFRPEWERAFVCLRNYETGRDISIEGAPAGIGDDRLPMYLLIVGTPAQVPWRLQYVLNNTRIVGRLHLTGDALDRYVSALIKWDRGESWPGSSAMPGRATVWATDHHEDDISHLMRDAIAAPLVKTLRGDRDLEVTFRDGAATPTTVAMLRDTLTATRPGLIVTTSHGRTGPIADPPAMAASLGQPVAHDGDMVTADALLDGGWTPSGAIWYSHACCSAGSDATSNFAGLFAKQTDAEKMLAAVAGLGATVAPLPTALLGHDRPLRAFVGHVEPTFDWTIEQQATGQFLTSGLVEALYERMYVAKGAIPSPIGYALRGWFARSGGLDAVRRAVEDQFARGAAVDRELTATRLAARDLESTVILGDPTVAIPPLG